MSASKVVTKVLSATAAAAGIACAGIAAGVALAAPRVGDDVVEAGWARIRRHRYAHRGLHDLAQGIPENSLPAFRRARERGFGVELDVHLTRDDRLVVIHDSLLRRACGVPGVVEDMTFADLRELGLFGTDERAPELSEVLAIFEPDGFVPAPAPIIVEVKPYADNQAILTKAVMAALDASHVDYCVESFDPRVVAWLRSHRPEVIRGQLAENSLRHGRSDLPLPMRLAGTLLLGNVAARPDFVAYRFEDREEPITLRAIRELFDAHVVTWTIRNEADLLVSEAEGAVGIFEGFVPAPESTI